MAERTTKQQLADALLTDAGGLDQFVSDRRAQGMPWRRISRDILNATDGAVDVTEASLRAWYREPVPSS